MNMFSGSLPRFKGAAALGIVLRTENGPRGARRQVMPSNRTGFQRIIRGRDPLIFARVEIDVMDLIGLGRQKAGM
jgi:hypothetical protein